MNWSLIIQFLLLTVVISGAIIFALRWVLFNSVDGAKQRLDRDAEAARQREAELSQKVKEADEQLRQRKKELDVIERKMRQDMEEQSSKQREEMVNKARAEAEEIIVKAQNAKEAIRKEVEKNMELKIIDYSVSVINEVFTVTVKDALDRQLFKEFIDKLNAVDMSRLGPDVKTADVITANPLDQNALNEIAAIFKTKLNRDIKFNPKIDKTLVGGVMLQFESLLLDGSLQKSFKEAAAAIKLSVEKQYSA